MKLKILRDEKRLEFNIGNSCYVLLLKTDEIVILQVSVFPSFQWFLQYRRWCKIVTLDIGCGSAPSGDVNLDRQYFGKRKNFVIADAHYLPFKNEAFDKVYSSYLLEHLENPCRFFREARRVLKDGGILECIYPSDSMMKKRIVLELLNLSIFKALKWKKRITGDENDPCPFGGHRWQLPDDRVHRILEKAGFTEVLFYKVYSKSILERGGKWLGLYKLPRIDEWKIVIQANKYLPKWELDTKFVAKI